MNKKQQTKKAEIDTEKKLPPINGAAIQQYWNNDEIARCIERYLSNTAKLCMRVKEAEKLAALDKMSLGDIIFTLQDPYNGGMTKTEIMKYFNRQLHIKIETF